MGTACVQQRETLDSTAPRLVSSFDTEASVASSPEVTAERACRRATRHCLQFLKECRDGWVEC